MKKIILASFLLMSIPFLSHAVEYDEFRPIHTAVPLLTIAPDARGGGMGDVGAATSADVNSQYWNPAKYPFQESRAGFGISYTPWLSKLVDDINLANVSGYWQFMDGQALSASLRYFSLGEVIFRQNETDDGFAVTPNEFAIDLGYSRLLAEKFSAAVAMRYIRSDLNTSYNATSGQEMFPGNAFAADIAAFFSTPIIMSTGDANLAFGLNISNIGTKITYDKGATNYFLPANFRLGGSFTLPFDDFNKLTLNADINKLLVPTYPERKDGESDADYKSREDDYNDMSSIAGIFKSFGDAPDGFKEELKEIMWSVGLEYSYSNQFFVRGGYFHESPSKGNRQYFTAGVGFKLNIFELDAAYVIATSASNPLDQTLRFSLIFDIGGIKSLMQ